MNETFISEGEGGVVQLEIQFGTHVRIATVDKQSSKWPW